MTANSSGPRVPGTTLLTIARLVFNEQLISTVVQPTISDLQREIAAAGPHSVKRLRAQWRGYRAFWTVMLVAPLTFRPSPAQQAGAVAFPDAVGRLAVGSIVVALLVIVGPLLGVLIAGITAAGALIAMAMHAWYVRHPSDIPVPIEPKWRTPQINFSSTEVAGNVGGLIFVVGSVFIVAIGLPSVIWFLFVAVVAGSFLAWALVVWHASHPKRGLPENLIVLKTVAFLLFAVPALAQSPAFEAISIKPARSSDQRNTRMRVLPNGDLDASAVPVLLLLRYAYDMPVNPSPRFSGLPGGRETYDIEAKAPANAVPPFLPESEKRGRRQAMIRGLLADRFKLVMRVEQKTMRVYALSVATGGPNLQKSTVADNDCVFDTGGAESCHNFTMGRGHPLNAKAIDMDDLARYIENWTDMPVVNRTAVSGLFAVETEGWIPMRLPPPPPGNPGASFDDLPTIFTVLRTLGLELKQQEAAVPVYTVEHIERPASE